MKDRDETQFTTKIDGFLSFTPPWMVMYFFPSFLKISPCVWPNSGFWWCVSLTSRITLLYNSSTTGIFIQTTFNSLARCFQSLISEAHVLFSISDQLNKVSRIHDLELDKVDLMVLQVSHISCKSRSSTP
jgi:hypothetical protein